MSKSGLCRNLALFLAIAMLIASVNGQEHVQLVPQLGSEPMSAALSPDGRYLLTGGEDARLWDAGTGRLLRSFRRTGAEQIAGMPLAAWVTFESHGKLILAGGFDGAATLWDLETGKTLRSFASHREMGTSLVLSPDERLVLISSVNALDIWDSRTGQLVKSIGTQARLIRSAQFSPDGRSILIGEIKGTAQLWDIASGKRIRSFEGHKGSVNAVAFSKDGHFVLTGDQGRAVRMWDVATGKTILTLITQPEQHAAPNESILPEAVLNMVNSVAFSPNSHEILAASGNTATLWDSATGKPIRSFQASSPVSSAVFSSDGQMVLTTDWNSAGLWDVSTGQLIRSFRGHTSEVRSARFAPNGRMMAIAGGGNAGGNGVSLWETKDGKPVLRLGEPKEGVSSLVFSRDSSLLLTGNYNGTANLWDSASGHLVRSFESRGGSFTCVALSPDSRYVVTAGFNAKTLLWDVSNGSQIRAFDPPISVDSKKGRPFERTAVASLSFSPDGQFILIGTYDDTARLWDVSTGLLIRSFEEEDEDKGKYPKPLYATFSPDGKQILTASNHGKVRLWDLTTGRQVQSFEGDSGAIGSAAFSPDGHYVLTAGNDRTARLWNAETGKQIRSFEGNSAEVWSAEFSPNGRFVLTGGADTTTRLWDTMTGQELATLLFFDGPGWAVVDPSGRYDADDPDNTPGLVWVTENLRAIELQDLKDNYYTPGLLARILNGERLPTVKGLDSVPAPPSVEIASSNSSTKKNLLISVSDNGGGIGKVVVRVNDRQIKVFKLSIRKGLQSKIKLNLDLSQAPLLRGSNTVNAYGFDAGNQIRSHEATATFLLATDAKGLKAEAAAEEPSDYKPQFYGIVIGTGKYADHRMDLQFPAHDAQSVLTAMEIGAGHLFGSENVHLRSLTTASNLDQDQPTKRNIVSAFEDVQKRAKPTDVLLVYLSGHGVSLQNEKDSYYYLTSDARSLEIGNNRALKDLSTVSSAELEHWLGAKNMPLKEVLILDTCAAGAATTELLKLVEKRDIPPDQRRAIEFLKEGTGTVILMGSAADKSSYEASKYGQGLLTYALLDGMRGRAVGEGGQLNVARWFQSASEEVPELARSIGGIQKPVIAAPHGTGFPVALLDSRDQTRIPLAKIKPELLHLSCHNEDDEDPLALASDLRERLRNISHPLSRGNSAQEPPIVYLDEVDEGPTDALTPRIVYKVTDNRVSLRLRIVQNGKTLKEELLDAETQNRGALVDLVAAKIIAMSTAESSR